MGKGKLLRRVRNGVTLFQPIFRAVDKAVQHKRYCRLAALACAFLSTALRVNGDFKLRLPS